VNTGNNNVTVYMSSSYISFTHGTNRSPNSYNEWTDINLKVLIIVLNTKVCASAVLPHLCPNFHLTRELHISPSPFYPGLHQRQDLSTFTTGLSVMILHSKLISQIFLFNIISVKLLFNSDTLSLATKKQWLQVFMMIIHS